MEVLVILFLLVLPWNSGSSQSPGTVHISGVITDSAGRAIQFANVKALPNGRRIVAGEDGRFVFEVDTTVRSIEIRRIGFEPKVVTAEVWPDSALQISLAALPAQLSRVRVEAEQRIRSLEIRGFYERGAELEKGINHGFMVTPEEIEQRKGARLTDFLLGHPAVKVATARPPGGFSRRSTVRSGLQPQGLGGCRMEIYIDGIRFYTKGPKEPHSSSDAVDYFVNDQISTSSIAAMEVYPRGVGAPPKYQSLNGTCGVILIWTR